ncbi:hypothetical protein WR25_26163 isoform C [Diploscapter pachys]|uniref:EF-hand domain-containing protein n=1 Tax=Diploscapter pachys TaxID=2018661 RepID=A0A2A2J695_9BILA|nr:hypothetical protein WR25_26163 isoform B [Diploscapter pachys]PAV57144.1 hypothetical protein WR25_26163 isoform C [Diploscapter pachys]
MTSIMEDIHDAFHFYDNKGDKKIAASQIGNCIRSLNLHPSEELVKKMTAQWKDPDARVSVEEFTPIYHNIKKEIGKPPTQDQFVQLLTHFDRDGSGTVPVSELRSILQNAGERMSSLDVDNLLYGMDFPEGKARIKNVGF